MKTHNIEMFALQSFAPSAGFILHSDKPYRSQFSHIVSNTCYFQLGFLERLTKKETLVCNIYSKNILPTNNGAPLVQSQLLNHTIMKSPALKKQKVFRTTGSWSNSQSGNKSHQITRTTAPSPPRQESGGGNSRATLSKQKQVKTQESKNLSPDKNSNSI